MAIRAYEEKMKDYDAYKLLASLVKDDVLVLAGVEMSGHIWDTVRPSEANLIDVNMGLIMPTALGLALALPHRKVLDIEGDGSVLLNMGNLSLIAWNPANNLTVIIMDNASYTGPPEWETATARVTDLEAVAKGAGIKNTKTVWTLEEFEKATRDALEKNELSVIVAKIRGTPVPRPQHCKDGRENKYVFVRYIERTEKKRILRPYGFPSEEFNLFGVAKE